MCYLGQRVTEQLGRRGVVGFACCSARHEVDLYEFARHFVSREPRSGFSDDVMARKGSRVLARSARDDANNPLSEALVVDTEDQTIVDSRIRLNNLFDFFGIHLFAASIDALRSSP